MAQYEYPNITIEDYQTINHNSQSARYEYLDGELRMLAGGSADHNLGVQNCCLGRLMVVTKHIEVLQTHSALAHL